MINSNVAPQASKFNQNGWKRFEEHLSDYCVAENKILLAISGVAYNPRKPNRHKSGTLIPDFFWYAVYEQASGKSMGLWVENKNKKYPKGLENYEKKDTTGKTDFLNIFELQIKLKQYNVLKPSGHIFPFDAYLYGDLDIGGIVLKKKIKTRV